MKFKSLVFVALLIVTCGPSEEEIQSQIDAAVSEVLATTSTTTSTTTTTLAPTTTTTTLAPTTTTTTLAPTTTTTTLAPTTTTTTLAPTTTTTTLAPTTTTTTLACNKRADNIPPKVESYTINKNSVDVASKSEDFKVTLRITDDCSGVEVNEILITFGDTGFAYNRKRISGNSLDGIYEVTVNVPEGHKIGNFEVKLFPVDDENGNTYVPQGQVNGFISIGYVDVK
jgi:hypothetical protein